MQEKPNSKPNPSRSKFSKSIMQKKGITNVVAFSFLAFHHCLRGIEQASLAYQANPGPVRTIP